MNLVTAFLNVDIIKLAILWLLTLNDSFIYSVKLCNESSNDIHELLLLVTNYCNGIFECVVV